MRSKLIFAVVLVVIAGAAVAAVKSGENILINGAFEAEQLDFPMFWQKDGTGVSFNATGGPGNTGAIVFSNPDEKGVRATVRQHDQQLVAGETYKMSAQVKTKGFKSRHHGVIIHDNGWFKGYGIQLLPENTEGWQLLEQTFKLGESKDNVYGLAIFAVDYTGEVQFAQVKLEAISDGALAGSSASPAARDQNKPRLVAWEPLLNKIPLSDPKLSFKFFGATEGPLTGYDAVYTIDGTTTRKLPLTREAGAVDLKGVTKGDHKLEAAIVNRATQEKVFEIEHVITLIDVPKVDTSKHKRLNNLVVEVLAQPLQATGAAQNFEFSTARDGWVFIKVETKAEDAGLKVNVGDDTVITATTDRKEAFRELPLGTHRLSITGAGSGGNVVVRSIAEIFNYPALGNSQIPQNGLYDWDFHVKYLFPSLTTLNGGSIPEEYRPKVRQMGLKWLANAGTTNPKDVADLVERMSKNAGWNEPYYDGFTADEQFFGRPNLSLYTDAVRALPNPENRLVYTWIVGKPGLPGSHNDFMSASLNASRGKGRLLFEAYCHARPSEEDAVAYLNDRVVDTMQRFNDYFPNAVLGTGMLFGNFNQIPIISLDGNPEVDYKYYLDMQLNLAANHPVFKDLATTGYWGSYYDDEELYRWSFALLRHYCVEGKTDLLSKDFAYRYSPGHLTNCDFVDGLKGWTASTAEGIKTESFSGYGRGSQNRWGSAAGAGDTFAVFARGAAPNTLTQTASGLTPGKVYTLQFVTADYKDMVARKVEPKENKLKAVLGEGAEVIPEKSYIFVDKRIGGRKPADDGLVRINLHHVRFKATAPSFTVTFTDADAAPGTETALNYVMMKPYFEN